ncbi:MAG: exodeoxyribonuclease VII small subunit [Clostridiales Family XIII bacterium]|jgi:exodeoxyribonuclease VII small subunit|nr:exodeoxyribonuclease VII small subunit [Clostridiales Family XIII bacterium]
MATKGTDRIGFEQALEKLEEYSELLSREGVTLEEAMRAYEEGIRYYGVCARMLDEAKQRIETLDPDAGTGEGIAADD